MEHAWAWQEMRGAALWDGRCRRSVAAICERRLERPRVSFSKACGEATRQAAHRVCAHARTTVDGLLKGHFQQTAARCAALHQERALQQHPLLLVADTTSLNYASHPATEGLGPINQTKKGRGLLAHSVLALPFVGVPVGLVHVAIWARDPGRHGKSRDAWARTQTPTALKEGQKWLDGLWGAEATLPPEVPALMVADREADLYEFFAAPRRPGLDLLVRAHQPRCVAVPGADETQSLWEAVESQPVSGEFTVDVPRQRGKPARTATLALRRTPLTLFPPGSTPRNQTWAVPLQLWVVLAQEINPPAEVEPITWLLLTTLPVPDFAAGRQLIAYYTRRWVIEELHLVLKSGLGAERLQCDDAHTLKNSLALFYVVAWKVLHLRDFARCFPEAPAHEVMDTDERAVLEAAEGHPLPHARMVVRALAHFGGFPRYPSAGEPGVRSIWDGLQRLEGAVAGWRLAQMMRNQSYEPR
jgi:hypothetical protein